MFSERERFINYTEANDGQLVTVGGLNHTPVVGHGSVSFRAKLPSGQITLVTLRNVLHVPSLGANLSQMVTYLVCDELKYGFKSAYEQS